MTKFIKYSLIIGVLAFSSCKKYLDVNEPNPNSATFSTPELVLPQATAYVASNFSSFNTYAAQIIGYHVNAGGYGGWGSTFTYEYTTSQYNNLWTNSYDNILDLEYVIENTQGEDDMAYFNGVSKILKAYLYQQLVDEYNDIPYSEAAKGKEFVTPRYDSAEDVYRSLADVLDDGINTIKSAQLPTALGTADVMFDGDMERWIQLANTIKLRLYVRASETDVFQGQPTFSSEGFLTDDALVNPGYQRLDGKQNPTWNQYHSDYTASAQIAYGRQWLPSRFAVAFYDGNKISDDGRGEVTYRQWPSVPTNFLGNTPTPDNLPTVGGTLGSSPFYIGSTGANGAANTIGTLKGSGMGQPIMLAAESYFLQAEAALKGIISGNYTNLFNSGIVASFRYLYKDVNGVVAAAYDPVGAAEAYHAENPNSRLVNINLATTDAQRLEAIITQKYIAYNNIGAHVAWAEFRRTGYPAIVTNGSPEQTFVSTRTGATTPDRLPGRILYPITEFSLNQDNVPSGISVSGSYVFWDRRN